MRWYNGSSEVKVGYNDVLIVPQRSDIPSRTEVNLARKFKFKHGTWYGRGIPIIAANMDSTGSFRMADALAKHYMFTALHKHYSREELVDFFSKKGRRHNYVFYSLGLGDLDKMLKVRADLSDIKFPRLINIDVANGQTETFIQFIKHMRRKMAPESVIMAGNVVGPNMAEHLLLCGADIVKVGIGPGSVCTTRVKAGVGYPQLSAVDEASYTAHGLRGHICADGGCTRVGDICKAFAAGADFVMLGGMLAGTDECEGEWIYNEIKQKDLYVPKGTAAPITGETEVDVVVTTKSTTKKVLKFYGMASEEAQDKYDGGMKGYKAEEGKCVEVPYKGPVEQVVREIKGGLASACTYVGAARIKDLPKCASFVRCTQQENTIFG